MTKKQTVHDELVWLDGWLAGYFSSRKMKSDNYNGKKEYSKTICQQLKCEYAGNDRDEGYPVCNHTKAWVYCIDGENCEAAKECGYYPALMEMHTCPLNKWIMSGNKRIPITQKLLASW